MCYNKQHNQPTATYEIKTILSLPPLSFQIVTNVSTGSKIQLQDPSKDSDNSNAETNFHVKTNNVEHAQQQVMAILCILLLSF